MEEKIQELKDLVNRNYDSDICAATSEWSSGNDDDVFDNGYECGASWIAYYVGKILGMDLEEPRIDN